MPIPLAIPIALKVGSAIFNSRNAAKNRKRAERAAGMDSLVGALSKGRVQSNTVPRQTESMMGNLLGMGGDAAMLYRSLGGGMPGGGQAAQAAGGAASSAMSPGGDISPGDASEMSSAYGPSRAFKKVAKKAAGIGMDYGPATPMQLPASETPNYGPDSSWAPDNVDYGPANKPWGSRMSEDVLRSSFNTNKAGNSWVRQPAPEYGPHKAAGLYDGNTNEQKRRLLQQLFGSLS